jgi:surface antigen
MPTADRLRPVSRRPRDLRLVLGLALAAALAGCMGLGGGGDKKPAATTVANQPSAAAGATLVRPEPDPNAVAMLDVFRRQLGAGKTLDKADDVYAERSAQLALEYATDGSRRPWTNPETGTTGTVTPTSTYQDKDGTYCRRYDQTIQIRQRGSKEIKGQGEAKGGVACRQPSGRWKFMPASEG